MYYIAQDKSYCFTRIKLHAEFRNNSSTYRYLSLHRCTGPRVQPVSTCERRLYNTRKGSSLLLGVVEKLSRVYIRTIRPLHGQRLGRRQMSQWPILQWRELWWRSILWVAIKRPCYFGRGLEVNVDPVATYDLQKKSLKPIFILACIPTHHIIILRIYLNAISLIT